MRGVIVVVVVTYSLSLSIALSAVHAPLFDCSSSTTQLTTIYCLLFLNSSAFGIMMSYAYEHMSMICMYTMFTKEIDDI